MGAALGGAVTPRLQNVCSPPACDLQRLGVLSGSWVAADQSAVPPERDGKAGWPFSLRSPWCPSSEEAGMGDPEAGAGDDDEERAGAGQMLGSHCRASPAFLRPHPSDATLSSERKMGQVPAREGPPGPQTGRRWAPAWSAGLRFPLVLLGSEAPGPLPAGSRQAARPGTERAEGGAGAQAEQVCDGCLSLQQP